MTTAEAREKLTHHGLTSEQAAGVVDVLEIWGQERAVTKDYLDARLTELKADLRKEIADLRAEFDSKLVELRAEFGQLRAEFGNLRAEFGGLRAELGVKLGDLRAQYEAKLRGQTVWITTVIVLGVIVQHFWK
jgi:hypothetical protein